MVDVGITREERLQMILEYDLRIEQLEAELAQVMRERRLDRGRDVMAVVRNCGIIKELNVRRDFIKLQRDHLESIWYYAKAEGISEREYAEWKERQQLTKPA